jgi:hypothetical protein
MRRLPASLCLFLLGSLVVAQDRLPQDEARRYARPCAEQAATLTDAQLSMSVDPEKPCALRGEGGGAMIIPDKKLSEEALRKAGEEVIPVGQLWLRKWTVVVGGKAVPDDRLRILTVNLDDKDRPMPLLLLGLRKKGDKDAELVVYAKDSEPLQVLALQKLDLIQDLPVELEWKRGEKDADTLTVKILGRYQAVLTVMRR